VGTAAAAAAVVAVRAVNAISARARAVASVLAAPIIRASDQQQQQRIRAIGRLTFVLAGNGIALILLLAAEVTTTATTAILYVAFIRQTTIFFACLHPLLSLSPPLFFFNAQIWLVIFFRNGISSVEDFSYLALFTIR
jgi:hypothetical protein